MSNNSLTAFLCVTDDFIMPPLYKKNPRKSRLFGVLGVFFPFGFCLGVGWLVCFKLHPLFTLLYLVSFSFYHDFFKEESGELHLVVPHLGAQQINLVIH